MGPVSYFETSVTEGQPPPMDPMLLLRLSKRRSSLRRVLPELHWTRPGAGDSGLWASFSVHTYISIFKMHPGYLVTGAFDFRNNLCLLQSRVFDFYSTAFARVQTDNAHFLKFTRFLASFGNYQGRYCHEGQARTPRCRGTGFFLRAHPSRGRGFPLGSVVQPLSPWARARALSPVFYECDP